MSELATDFSKELSHYFGLRNSIDPIALKYIVGVMTKSITYSQKHYLTDLYKQAVEAGSKHEQIYKFKLLGDYSLFTAGYFPDSVSSVGYYEDMGSAAYYQVYSLGRDKKPFYELALRYGDCIEALNHLSSVQKHYSFDQIGDMYVAYMETQSPTLQKKLYRFGMFSLEGAIG
jgi:hypothetical protein